MWFCRYHALYISYHEVRKLTSFSVDLSTILTWDSHCQQASVHRWVRFCCIFNTHHACCVLFASTSRIICMFITHHKSRVTRRGKLASYSVDLSTPLSWDSHSNHATTRYSNALKRSHANVWCLKCCTIHKASLFNGIQLLSKLLGIEKCRLVSRNWRDFAAASAALHRPASRFREVKFSAFYPRHMLNLVYLVLVTIPIDHVSWSL